MSFTLFCLLYLKKISAEVQSEDKSKKKSKKKLDTVVEEEDESDDDDAFDLQKVIKKNKGKKFGGKPD